MKQKIYYPKLQTHIQLIINNCEKCQAIKYDRNPIKQEFSLTETPTKKHEIIQLDVFHFRKQTFVTVIDKLTKFAVAYIINDRNWVKKIAVIEGYVSTFNKPTMIIMDNEFKSEQVKAYLQEKNIRVHWTKSNNHTGNADVERLHSTLIEKIQAIEEDVSVEQLIHIAIGNYNNRFHSTIEMSPRDANNLVDLSKLVEKVKQKKIANISKKNQNREQYTEQREEGYIKNYKRVRHKDQPYYRKYKLKDVHVTNIKRPPKFSGNNSPNIADSKTDRGNDASSTD